MTRKLTPIAIAFVLLAPAPLFAGGPPRLCLPIDGVSHQNAAACGKLLAAKLKDKVWEHANVDRPVGIQEYKDQHYATFPMAEEVSLSEVEAALARSGYSIPRGKLHLFGHVIVEIDAGKSPAKELLTGLEELPYVSVAGSTEKEGRLLVTLDMPYPVTQGIADRETVGWEAFQRNDFSSDAADRSEPPAKAADLPSYSALRDLVAKHNAKLNDIRWSTSFACRALGGVVAQDTSTVTSANRGAGK